MSISQNRDRYVQLFISQKKCIPRQNAQWFVITLLPPLYRKKKWCSCICLGIIQCLLRCIYELSVTQHTLFKPWSEPGTIHSASWVNMCINWKPGGLLCVVDWDRAMRTGLLLLLALSLLADTLAAPADTHVLVRIQQPHPWMMYFHSTSDHLVMSLCSVYVLSIIFSYVIIFNSYGTSKLFFFRRTKLSLFQLIMFACWYLFRGPCILFSGACAVSLCFRGERDSRAHILC